MINMILVSSTLKIKLIWFDQKNHPWSSYSYNAISRDGQTPITTPTHDKSFNYGIGGIPTPYWLRHHTPSHQCHFLITPFKISNHNTPLINIFHKIKHMFCCKTKKNPMPYDMGKRLLCQSIINFMICHLHKTV